MRRWQVMALVALLVLPLLAALLFEPPTGQVEVLVWLACLVAVVAGPSFARRLRLRRA